MGLYKLKEINGKKVLIYHNKKIIVLIDEKQLKKRIKELGREITKDYEDKNPVLVSVLRGSFIFVADICREIKIQVTFDFMAVSSYRKSTTTGEVRIIMDLRDPVDGEHILIVEDIVDTGQTLNYLHNTLIGRNPASINTCVLTLKERTHVETPVKYLGFEIPDVWVVGYGLNYADTHRTLPYIAELRQEVYQT